MLANFLLNTHYTDADLVAERVVQANRLSATTLSFALQHSANFGQLGTLFNTTGFQPGGFDIRAIRIKKDGKLNFKYRLKTVKKGGDDGLCAALNLQVVQNWQVKYQGRLLDLNLDTTIPTSGFDNWIFYLSIDSDQASLKNKTCEFDLDFKTWRNNPEEKTGFWAQRLINSNVSSGNW
ncbi:hypothetical protein M1523_03540 [Patescibacteria group bacterium]|nr:hypothetical protein [Patescibacteria group bacterium]MCL5092024.1 hypothetical protein [Patescibacteria group bacterium]